MLWQPLQGLSISQYAGYTVGYYESHVLNSSGVDFDGQPLSFPKWSYGGDASYDVDVGNFKITPEVNYSFHDTYSQYYLLDVFRRRLDYPDLRRAVKELSGRYAPHAVVIEDKGSGTQLLQDHYKNHPLDSLHTPCLAILMARQYGAGALSHGLWGVKTPHPTHSLVLWLQPHQSPPTPYVEYLR